MSSCNGNNSIERDSGISEMAADDDADGECQMFENRCGLSQDLRFLSGMPELCDVMFLVGEEREPVYGVKAILAIRSRVFYKMLYGPKSGSKQQRLISSSGHFGSGTIGKRLLQKMMPDSSPQRDSQSPTRSGNPNYTPPSTSSQKTVVHIDEFESEVFKQLLEYVHTGSVLLQPRTLLGLLNAADHFGLEELRRACAEFSHKCISIETVCSLLVTAEHYIQYKSTKIFVQRVLEFVDQHGDEVLQLNDFVHLPRHVVEILLSREELEASDVNKYRAAERWSRHFVLYHPNAALRAVMNQFTKYVAFHAIPTHVIMREIRPQNIVADEILMSALAYQADPGSVSPREFQLINAQTPNRHKHRSSVCVLPDDVKCFTLARRSRSVDRNLSKLSNEGSNCDSGYNEDSAAVTVVQIECDEAYGSGGRAMSCYDLAANFKF